MFSASLYAGTTMLTDRLERSMEVPHGARHQPMTHSSFTEGRRGDLDFSSSRIEHRLHGLTARHCAVGPSHPHRARTKYIERLLRHPRDNFPGNSAGRPVRVSHNQMSCPRHRLHHRGCVKWTECPEVDDLGTDPRHLES